MGRAKAPAWTDAEVAILTEIYPAQGVNGAAEALPGRTWHAIHVKAHKLGLASAYLAAAPEPKLRGDDLEEAIRLREECGWSFARIGATFGVCESSASNAVLIALCPRKGFRPAERDANGRLTAAGMERLRLMLRKGLKPVDIQLRLGVSASRIAEERRRYSADLKARGKAPLPPAGGGERYSGARIDRATIKEVHQLLLSGLGTAKVAAATGVSHTHVGRQRNKLVARLRRRGECLSGCDINGRRVKVKDCVAAVPEASKATLRRLLLDGIPVARAARLAAVGASHAYRLRDELAAELASRGERIPPIKRLGRKRAKLADMQADWLPRGRDNLILYRRFLLASGDEAEARRLAIRAIAEREGMDPNLAEQLDRVRRGGTVTRRFEPRRAAPDMTLGGIATAAL